MFPFPPIPILHSISHIPHFSMFVCACCSDYGGPSRGFSMGVGERFASTAHSGIYDTVSQSLTGPARHVAAYESSSSRSRSPTTGGYRSHSPALAPPPPFTSPPITPRDRFLGGGSGSHSSSRALSPRNQSSASSVHSGYSQRSSSPQQIVANPVHGMTHILQPQMTSSPQNTDFARTKAPTFGTHMSERPDPFKGIESPLSLPVSVFSQQDKFLMNSLLVLSWCRLRSSFCIRW